MTIAWKITLMLIPYVLQLAGFFLSLAGAHAHGVATSGKYTASQQAGPVYGQLGGGIVLFVSGLVAHRRSVTTAALAPPQAPSGIDPAAHTLLVAYAQMATTKGITSSELNTANNLIKTRMHVPPGDDKQLANGGATT
jgi:hypothetical protein